MDKINDGPQLETVVIFTRQMAQLAGWYKQALDLAPFESAPDHLGQQLGSIYLGFDQVDEALPDTPLGVTLWFTVGDIESTFARLVELGARVRYPPTQKPWGAILASVYDPDGNTIGIAQRQPAPTVARD
jgi:predicted enzyme related to lactoylglutathione lyase